jgi:penicillin-binding protein 1C
MMRKTVAAAVLASFAAVLFLVGSWFFIDWPSDASGEYPGGIVVKDAAGDILRVSLGPGDVDCRPFYVASPDDWIAKAVVASEDSSFWEHCGVRPLSILRATWQNLTSRRRISGASTITMQAVRLIKPHPKTLAWKWREAVMALKMERERDKEWILSQYLNRAPYGSNLVGIEAAAQGWFGKGAKDLGLGEAALLAGIVQAPSRFRPDRALERAIKRRDYVLGRMLELGMIDDLQLEAAKEVVPVVRRAPRPFKAPHFCDWALARGISDTALDADIQSVCESAVNGAAQRGGWSVAAVIVRVCDSEPVAMAVSGDYFNPDGGQVNTALAPRPAGSTLKPLLVALAMDLGLATPEERLNDAPKSYKGYRPANFDSKHRGLVTVRDALVLSLNLPFVQLLERVGVDRFGSLLRSLGFAHMSGQDSSFGLGMAIGNVEVSLLELVRAYASVARMGPALSPGACYLVSDILSGAERSGAALGHIADVAASRFAWKTGTSAAYRDAWTVAWNPEYVVGVWCGHMSGGFGDRTLVGAKAAAPVCWTIARALYPQNDGPWFVQPQEVCSREICSLTGLPANPDCPARETGRALAGRSSAALCAVHRRDADGNVVEVPSRRLEIVRPEDGSRFTLVEGVPQQRIACQVAENPADSRLWWFLDGTPVGESLGTRAFTVDMDRGEHVISCSTSAGITASACIIVE